MQLSPQTSHMTSFLLVNVAAKFQTEHRERGAEWERGRTNIQFSAKKSSYLKNSAR